MLPPLRRDTTPEQKPLPAQAAPPRLLREGITPHRPHPKVSLSSCQKSFIPRLPGILPGRHGSKPFREEIYRQHHDGIYAKALSLRQSLGQATPHYLGIDEKTLHKGQRFCTTFCDLKNRRIFDIQAGKSEADLATFLSKLKGRERVKVVCIDLSSSYRSLIRRYFPNARIVVDRFYIVRMASVISKTTACASSPNADEPSKSPTPLKPHKNASFPIFGADPQLIPLLLSRRQEIDATWLHLGSIR